VKKVCQIAGAQVSTVVGAWERAGLAAQSRLDSGPGRSKRSGR